MAALRRHTDHPLLQLGVFTLVYALSQAPALASAWWYLDDYPKILGHESAFHRACENGRPVEALWMATLAIDTGMEHAGANVALRSVQALAHVLVAWLGGRWIATALGRRDAVWMAALFLLWPFHTEAVLWRSAGSYPLGALLGVLAVRAAWPGRDGPGGARLAFAALLVAASALLNQTASLIVWVLPLIAVLLGARRVANARTIVALLVAHATAAVVSVLITRMPEYASARASLTTEPLAKLDLLYDLLRLLIGRRQLYPAALTACHVILIGAAIALAIRDRSAGIARSLRTAGLAAAVCVAPFATLLVTRDDWMPFRVMYLGPWIFVAAGCAALRWVSSPRRVDRWLARTALMAAAAAALAFYVPIGWRNARGYVVVFESEQRILDNATDLAAEDPARRVLVEPPPPDLLWNPFGTAYVFRNSQESALSVDYAIRGRVEGFTSLRLVGGPEHRAALDRAALELGPADRFRVVRDDRSGLVMILQPRVVVD